MKDNVNHPVHYTSDPSGVECITITRHRNFNIGNAIKYLWRAGRKDDPSMDIRQKTIEDLQKAVFYINDEIKRIQELKSYDPYTEEYDDFKNGDFVMAFLGLGTERPINWIAILNGIHTKKVYEVHAGIMEVTGLPMVINDSIPAPDSMRIASDDEKQLLLSKLHEIGKDWDAQERQIVDLKSDCENG